MFKVMFFGFLTSSDILVLKFILVFISFISNRFLFLYYYSFVKNDHFRLYVCLM